MLDELNPFDRCGKMKKTNERNDPMLFEKYINTVDQVAEQACAISDALWDNTELAYEEFAAVEMITKLLEEHGFTITRNIAGIPTAFTATYGSGKPAIGVQAEYDGLDGISQEAFCPVRKERPGVTKGHGCGHNLFAGGSVAAVLAIQSYIKEVGKGSVTLFGCPAEEGGAGKVYMARDGAYKDVDAVVSWHPEKMYMVRTRPSLANTCVNFTFDGVAAHAGGAPQKGRSALDAVELMNVGVQFLREHMDLTSRVHYAILDAGGTAPNQVQAHATVQYLIRAVDSEGVRELYERVHRIAQGAALMTDTTMSTEFHSAYSNLITIPTLQATANEAMHDIPLPVPTEEDLAFAAEIQKTMKLTRAEAAGTPYAMKVLDPAPPVAHGGSTDTADVSWVVPTVQMHIGNWVAGTPGHSWQAISQCRSPYGKRSMLYAGKAVAGTAIRLMENPELLVQARKEFDEKTVGGYICPIPDDVLPPPLRK